VAGCRCFHGRKELLGRLPCSREELAAAFPRSASSRGSPPSLGKHAAGGEGARAGAASSRAIQLSGQQADRSWRGEEHAQRGRSLIEEGGGRGPRLQARLASSMIFVRLVWRFYGCPAASILSPWSSLLLCSHHPLR